MYLLLRLTGYVMSVWRESTNDCNCVPILCLIRGCVKYLECVYDGIPGRQKWCRFMAEEAQDCCCLKAFYTQNLCMRYQVCSLMLMFPSLFAKSAIVLLCGPSHRHRLRSLMCLLLSKMWSLYFFNFSISPGLLCVAFCVWFPLVWMMCSCLHIYLCGE